MKSQDAPARVLVASDSVEDAAQIVSQLEADFPEIRASTDVDKAVDDFEAFKPSVLVVAFDGFQKAQEYVLGLYRSTNGHHAHSSLLLCNKDDVREAFEACRKGTFDDYVLYWPHIPDGFRLTMSVLNAARRMAATPAGGPGNLDLIAHARQLGALQTVLEQHVLEEERSANPADGSAQSAAPWNRQLKDKLAPHMNGLRAFGDEVRKIRPLVLFVEDDQFARNLTQKALEGKDYEVVFTHDGMSTLSLLRTLRPDMILMDVNLPDIDGVALTRKLKTMPHLAQVPVVMLTSEAKKQTLESSMSAGAVGFIVKPFTRDALRAKIDRFLGR